MQHSSRAPMPPTIFLIFGATGDLMAKKILPALFHLFQSGELPDRFRVVGVARRPLTSEEFHARIVASLEQYGHVAQTDIPQSFLDAFEYAATEFSKEEDYVKLKSRIEAIDASWGMCANKLLYLAVPPELYGSMFDHLASSRLSEPCGPKEGWTRVIVEKPFGKDLQTAEALDMQLARLFDESQIYRIDHYLAKEMIQNILAFRFSNNLFETDWGNDLIEQVHIRLFETLGVEERGSFYDGVGALRDVGQNHVLQLLALLTLDHPLQMDADTIRARRADVLEMLRVLLPSDMADHTFRAQYAGYQDIPGVVRGSSTETYFKIRGFLDHPRWSDVPFVMEGGKRLGKRLKEVEVVFRHPTRCFCPPGEHLKNRLVIHMEPTEGITIRFFAKKPGRTMEIEERTFDFSFRVDGPKAQYTEEYEKLLLDCIAGDQTLFASSREVRAMWRFTDPIVQAWQDDLVPLASYPPDTDEAIRASHALDSGVPVPELPSSFSREMGIVGLGKMGAGIARRLMEEGWTVHGMDGNAEAVAALQNEGVRGADDLPSLIAALPTPRILWLMIPAGKPVDDLLAVALPLLAKGDILIDGGNSFYKDSIERAARAEALGIHFIDAGVSGGPSGARHGTCLMAGGDRDVVESLTALWHALSVPDGFLYAGKSGAGHFVKMVHNGIEYGMMQSIAEGFAVLKASPFSLHLGQVADLYNHGSVITSRLTGWLADGFRAYGEDLAEISGSVAHTGEGAWTVEAGKEFGVETPIIAESLAVRVRSQDHPSYMGKILSALRAQFGGHSVTGA